MNKKLNNFKKRFVTLGLTAVLSLSSLGLVFADGARVVTLGANLTQEQKDTMLKYFGVNKDEVVIQLGQLQLWLQLHYLLQVLLMLTL